MITWSIAMGEIAAVIVACGCGCGCHCLHVGVAVIVVSSRTMVV